MMIKKILAAMTALAMCAGMVSCGNSAEKDTDDKGTESAAVTKTEKTEKPEDKKDEPSEKKEADSTENDESSKAEENSESKTEDDKPADESKSASDNKQADSKAESSTPLLNDETVIGTSTMRLINGKVIYVEDSSASQLESSLSDDEACQVVEAALRQYSAASAGDMGAFIDSFDFGTLKGPLVDLTELSMQYDENGFVDILQQNGTYTKFIILNEAVNLMSGICTDEAYEGVSYLNGADRDTIDSAIDQLSSSITPDNGNCAANIDSLTIYDSANGVEPFEALGDDTIYIVMPAYCLHVGDELYFKGYVTVTTENRYFELCNTDVWRVGGEYGAYIGYASVSDRPAESAGLNAAQLWEAMKQSGQTN